MALKRSLAWVGLAQGISFVLQFVGTVVLARYLTPYDTGIFAGAAATAAALSIIQACGLQNLIVRERVLDPLISASAFTINALIALLLAMTIAAMGYLGSAILHDAGVRKVLLVLAVTPLIDVFAFLPSANLERGGFFKTLALVATASSVAGTIVAIALAMLDFSYMSIAYAQIVKQAINAILMILVGREHVSFRMGLTAWRRVADFGLQMMAVSGISALSVRLSELAMARLLGLSALGIYARANSVNSLIATNIHLVIARVVFVDYAELHRRGVSLRQRYLLTVEVVTAILWPAFAGCAVLSRPFVFAVYGEKWLPAALPLSILATASIIRVSVTMTWELFAVTGNIRAQTRIEFVRAIVVLSAFVLGSTISIAGAACGSIVDGVFAVFAYRKHLDRMTATSLTDLRPIYARGAMLTLLAVAPAGLLMVVSGWSPSTSMSLVLGSVALGVAFWAAGLAWLDHPLMMEAKGLLGRLGQSARA